MGQGKWRVLASEKAVVCPWARRMALYLRGEIHVVRHELAPKEATEMNRVWLFWNDGPAGV